MIMKLNSLTELLEVTKQRPQAMRALMAGGADFTSLFNAASAALLPGQLATTNAVNDIGSLLATAPTSKTNALSATGRNMALFDPESAYAMMTSINNKEVVYKAQSASLQDMRTSLTGMTALGRTLADLPQTASPAELRSAMQNFADRYNSWRQEFDGAAQSGGLLADTRAAKVARYELDQSVRNMFLGADEGFRGLKDLGFDMSAATHRVTFNSVRFDAAMAANPQGVATTLREFGTNFSTSAKLLASEGNFITNQLKNLDRVMSYIGENRSALEQEFGTGDPAKPNRQVAAVLTRGGGV
jgi:hypothetical protein